MPGLIILGQKGGGGVAAVDFKPAEGGDAEGAVGLAGPLEEPVCGDGEVGGGEGAVVGGIKGDADTEAAFVLAGR